jgi:hypothetical protein
MHGSKRWHRNNSLPNYCFTFFVTISLLLAGCKGSEETSENTATNTTRKDFLVKYEKTFDPSDYDVDVNTVRAEEKKQHPELEGPSLLVTALPETIPGFRIQVFLTQDIDEANSIKDTVTAQLPDDWVYVIYDSPYYKVRVGNFPDRSSANLMVKKLVIGGYKDAWVVPDNVLKNPPPKLPDIQIEPEKPLDQHR